MSDWLEDRMAMLSWEEIRASQQAGIEIGSHSHTHRQLDVIPIHEATDEIHFSKACLEAFLDQPITTFAFPHGYYTSCLLQEVREAGFTSGCIVGNTNAAHDGDPFAIPRFMIEGNLPVPELQDLLGGRQNVSPRIWRESLRFVWRFTRRTSVLIRKPMPSPLGSSAQDWSVVDE
jgi:peptidoglycan/xylan/chitin deacetylase (PgdA/CDA1 family)